MSKTHDRLDEVLVITSALPRFSPEQQQDMATSDALKGAEAATIKEQQKASEIMAERLPGLTDPNAPPATAAQPGATPPAAGQEQAAPAAPPAPKLMHTQHPDRFSPGTAPEALPETTDEVNPKPRQGAKSPQNKEGLAPGVTPKQTAKPRRTP